MPDGTEFVGSHLKDYTSPGGVKSSQTGYGQNGYQGPSSLTKGTKANIPGVSVPTPTLANTNGADDQRRLDAVSGKAITVAHGMKSHSNSGETVPSALARKGR